MCNRNYSAIPAYAQKSARVPIAECYNVVLYFGGNDVAAGTSLTSVEQEFRSTLHPLDNDRRRVFFCSVCLRIDINVNPLRYDKKA